jgi:hypothetical protein
MASEASDEMMALLQELAALKEIDQTQDGLGRQQRVARKERQQRRTEVRAQIRQLARNKKASNPDQ